MSLYDHRVKIVAAALMKGSHGSELTNDAAIQLAVRAVYALDHIPVRGDDDNREAGRNPCRCHRSVSRIDRREFAAPNREIRYGLPH